MRIHTKCGIIIANKVTNIAFRSLESLLAAPLLAFLNKTPYKMMKYKLTDQLAIGALFRVALSNWNANTPFSFVTF